MFKRLSGVTKALKDIVIDGSHIKLKKTDMNFIIMTPSDLVQLGDLVGGGSEDVLLWIGKTVGAELAETINARDGVKKPKKSITNILNSITYMGFGDLKIKSLKEGKSATIEVTNPICLNVENKADAKSLENLYLGLFIGVFKVFGWEIAIDPDTFEDMAVQTKSALDSDGTGTLSDEYEFTFGESGGNE